MPVLGAKVIQSGAVVKRERAIFYKPVACNTGTTREGTREALGWDPGNCSTFLQAGGLQYWDSTSGDGVLQKVV